MAKRARSGFFAMRIYTTEERKLRRIARAAGFDEPADYIRDHIKREHDALERKSNDTQALPQAA